MPSQLLNVPPFRLTFDAELNPDSFRVTQGYVEPSAGQLTAETRVQFERHGYFVTDRVDHRLDKPVFNRVTTLKDSWGK